MVVVVVAIVVVIAWVVVVASAVVVAAVVVLVVVTDPSGMARQFVVAWRLDTYLYISRGTLFESTVVLPRKLALLFQLLGSRISPLST